mgnify:CR=1 FL=1
MKKRVSYRDAGVDIDEAERAEGAPHRRVDRSARPEVALHGGAAQVEVPMPEPEHLVHVHPVVEREGRRIGLAEHLDRAGDVRKLLRWRVISRVLPDGGIRIERRALQIDHARGHVYPKCRVRDRFQLIEAEGACLIPARTPEDLVLRGCQPASWWQQYAAIPPCARRGRARRSP